MEKLMITPETMATAGAVSYWRLSGTVNMEQLIVAWKAQGLDPKLLPSPPSPETALGRAVRELQTKRQLVRPLARRGLWAVVEERVEAGNELAYRTLVRAIYNQAAPDDLELVRVDATTAEFVALNGQIVANYKRFRGELDQSDISAWLVDLTSRSNAVSLRDTGGIYFVPRDSVESWRKVVAALRAVSAHQIFTIPAMKNSEAIEAISDAVAIEAEAIAVAMERELAATGDDALGERALATRALQCQNTIAKIAAYEGLLDVQLLKVRERIERLSADVAHAALLASADEAAAA